MKKTKEMFNNYVQDHEIKIDDEVIECVQEYIYLGQKLVHVQIMKKKSKEE